jgi:hypothetical protein
VTGRGERREPSGTGSLLRAIRLFLIALGAFILVVAIRGVLGALGPDLPHYIRYFVTAWLANDLFVMPLAIIAGFVLSRWLPASVKPVIQAALFISLAVVVIAYPLVLGRGVPGDNPSALPRNYTIGLLVTLGVVWLGAGLVIIVRRLRARQS